MKYLNKFIGIIITAGLFFFAFMVLRSFFESEKAFVDIYILFITLSFIFLLLLFVSLNNFGFGSPIIKKKRPLHIVSSYIFIFLFLSSISLSVVNFFRYKTDVSKNGLTVNKELVVMDTIQMHSNFKGILELKNINEQLHYKVKIIPSDKNYKNYSFVLELLDIDGFLIYEKNLYDFVNVFDKGDFAYVLSKGRIEISNDDIKRIKNYSILVKSKK